MDFALLKSDTQLMSEDQRNETPKIIKKVIEK